MQKLHCKWRSRSQGTQETAKPTKKKKTKRERQRSKEETRKERKKKESRETQDKKTQGNPETKAQRNKEKQRNDEANREERDDGDEWRQRVQPTIRNTKEKIINRKNRTENITGRLFFGLLLTVNALRGGVSNSVILSCLCAGLQLYSK